MSENTTTQATPITQREKIIALLILFLIRVLNKSESLYSFQEPMKEIISSLHTTQTE